MLAYFFIAVLSITTVALENEGGADCLNNGSQVECIEKAVKNSEPVDYSKLNG